MIFRIARVVVWEYIHVNSPKWNELSSFLLFLKSGSEEVLRLRFRFIVPESNVQKPSQCLKNKSKLMGVGTESTELISFLISLS